MDAGKLGVYSSSHRAKLGVYSSSHRAKLGVYSSSHRANPTFPILNFSVIVDRKALKTRATK